MLIFSNRLHLVMFYVVLFLTIFLSLNLHAQNVPQIKKESCWNKFDQKVIQGFPHPDQGIWIEVHDSDKQSIFYHYCLDSLGSS